MLAKAGYSVVVLEQGADWSQPKAEAPAKLLKIDMAFSP